jgi:ElaB/YqjD/DUF883 family membrane-anchored ribosome-binding protein
MAETKSSTGTVAQAKETGSELVTQAKEQLGAKTAEVRDDAAFQLREQVEQRSVQAGDQIHAVGQALRAGVDELRTDGKGASADVVEVLARRADDLGAYLQSTNADRILDDIESFARRRPWLTAGAAAVAGFVASRVVKASSDRRYERSSSAGLAAGAAR